MKLPPKAKQVKKGQIDSDAFREITLRCSRTATRLEVTLTYNNGQGLREVQLTYPDTPQVAEAIVKSIAQLYEGIAEHIPKQAPGLPPKWQG